MNRHMQCIAVKAGGSWRTSFASISMYPEFSSHASPSSSFRSKDHCSSSISRSSSSCNESCGALHDSAAVSSPLSDVLLHRAMEKLGEIFQNIPLQTLAGP